MIPWSSAAPSWRCSPCFSWLAANNRRSFPHPLAYLWKIPAADALASAQLGELDGLLSEAELAHVHTLVEQLLPLRQAREGENRWRLSTEEANLVDRLNRLYERYTLKYLGGGGSWGYASPAERRWPTMPWSRTAASG